MKKILWSILGLILIPALCFAGTATRYLTYATTSQVTSTNLNGNFDNLVTVLNGGLDNTNANTASGFRFYEVLGSLPAVGTQGRAVFLTTDNSLNFDNGSSFTKALTVAGAANQGEIIYYNGSAWTRLAVGTANQVLITNGAGANPSWGSGSKVIQAVNTQTGAMSTGSTAFPADNNTPQNTGGDQYMSLAITPTSATNILRIDVTIILAGSANGQVLGAALFQDTTANALASSFRLINSSTGAGVVTFTHWMTAGTTSATTFKVRAGNDGGATTTVNGFLGTAYYNGTMRSSITITELTP